MDDFSFGIRFEPFKTPFQFRKFNRVHQVFYREVEFRLQLLFVAGRQCEQSLTKRCAEFPFLRIENRLIRLFGCKPVGHPGRNMDKTDPWFCIPIKTKVASRKCAVDKCIKQNTPRVVKIAKAVHGKVPATAVHAIQPTVLPRKIYLLSFISTSGTKVPEIMIEQPCSSSLPFEIEVL